MLGRESPGRKERTCPVGRQAWTWPAGEVGGLRNGFGRIRFSAVLQRGSMRRQIGDVDWLAEDTGLGGQKMPDGAYLCQHLLSGEAGPAARDSRESRHAGAVTSVGYVEPFSAVQLDART